MPSSTNPPRASNAAITRASNASSWARARASDTSVAFSSVLSSASGSPAINPSIDEHEAGITTLTTRSQQEGKGARAPSVHQSERANTIHLFDQQHNADTWNCPTNSEQFAVSARVNEWAEVLEAVGLTEASAALEE